MTSEQFSWELEVSPGSVGLFAGSPVYFSGPCLLPSQNLRCRFGTHEVYGMAVPDTQSKGVCVAPTLHMAGWMDFCVSTNAGTDYHYCTQIYISKSYSSKLFVCTTVDSIKLENPVYKQYGSSCA